MYGHLGKIHESIEVGKKVFTGMLMGTSGISGNAGLKNGEYQNDVIPHVHIRARKNNQKYDPANLLSTKFNKTTGKALNSNPCNK